MLHPRDTVVREKKCHCRKTTAIVGPLAVGTTKKATVLEATSVKTTMVIATAAKSSTSQRLDYRARDTTTSVRCSNTGEVQLR